jgi:hypothetical protein
MEKNNDFCWHLEDHKITDEKSWIRSRIRIPQPGPGPHPHPDPVVKGTDPRIRIRIRIRTIRKTGISTPSPGVKRLFF